MDSPDVQMNLRLPKAIGDQISAAARRNRRSKTAEVTLRLEESFEREERGSSRQVAEPRPGYRSTAELMGELEALLARAEAVRGEVARRLLKKET